MSYSHFNFPPRRIRADSISHRQICHAFLCQRIVKYSNENATRGATRKMVRDAPIKKKKKISRRQWLLDEKAIGAILFRLQLLRFPSLAHSEKKTPPFLTSER